ncbi:triose-phosphate isomerase [Vibrio sp. ZSDZ65]|uniref:Triosephosphate isomerase n=1 Tax=Vibrio qingdaonensis TaxID=2829491 RepID=A0A9X3CLX8_9VIBR|nr:triose-phosphate isomerase [Vibrio qingdaonensis]MCW8345869.1 triose-phosphate isomerase [Vibrio qingdaonensis]
MKKIWVGTSWKMNKTGETAQDWANAVSTSVKNCNAGVQPFVIPPFPYITNVVSHFSDTKMKVGAQNMCWQDEGAFTGEVSPVMLKDCGATLVEIGHSERRGLFGESDKTVNQKVRAALKHGLTPLVCVGDSADEKQWGVSIESVVRQVKIALFQVPLAQVSQVIIAYEPIWAIGENGTPATNEEAEGVHQAIREALSRQYGEPIAQDMTLLYGGSVNLDNASELLDQPNIDGVFVGRTAWQASGYLELLSIAQSKANSTVKEPC